MANLSKQELLKTPIDVLYIFTNNTFISLVKKYMGVSQAKTIAQKAANQRKLLNNIYGSKKEFEEKGYTEIAAAIEAQYGMTPVTILKKLLAGETVAGKNWKEGIYGVGSSNSDGFIQNSNVKVNTETGMITNKGASMGQGIATYDKKGNAVGYSFTDQDGTQYSSRYDKRTKKWYSNTYSNSEGMAYSDGTKYEASTSSSVWENINTAMPIVQKFIEWLASIFNFTPITKKNTIPAQEEFIDRTGGKTNLSTIGIIGMALIGGYLIMGGTSKK